MTIRTDGLISNRAGDGPANLHKQSAAKCYVNFNGSGTVAARKSLNLSSITDINTGRFDLNFVSAMSDAAYPLDASGSTTGNLATTTMFAGLNTTRSKTAALAPIAYLMALDGSWYDEPQAFCTINGDLA